MIQNISMNASQSLQIYEIPQSYFKNDEDAKKVVKAIEEVVENKIEAQSKDFETIVNKDVSSLRGEIKEDMAKMKGELTTVIAETKADIIKWMFIFWAGQLAAMFAFLKFFK